MINPGINNCNISLQKEFAVRERVRLQMRGDAFNALQSHAVQRDQFYAEHSALTNGRFTNLYLNPNGSINNKNGFGIVDGARDSRIMHLGVRLQF